MSWTQFLDCITFLYPLKCNSNSVGLQARLTHAIIPGIPDVIRKCVTWTVCEANGKLRLLFLFQDEWVLVFHYINVYPVMMSEQTMVGFPGVKVRMTTQLHAHLYPVIFFPGWIFTLFPHFYHLRLVWVLGEVFGVGVSCWWGLGAVVWDLLIFWGSLRIEKYPWGKMVPFYHYYHTIHYHKSCNVLASFLANCQNNVLMRFLTVLSIAATQEAFSSSICAIISFFGREDAVF